ncbi:YsnF/AvaK domain-containing protein [Rhodococcus aerolatus]
MAGTVVLDAAGAPVGRVRHLYPDPMTHDPEWASVAPDDGWARVLAPLAGAVVTPTGVVLAHPANVILAGPAAPDRDTLSDNEVLAATGYYYQPGIAPGAGLTAPDPTTSGTAAVRDGGDSDGNGADAGAGVVVVRSKEQLRTGTERVVAQRLRVRKVVVTEERTITVTVRHEEYRIETIPADEHPGPGQPLDPTPSSDAGGGDELVLTLHAEQPVVSLEVVPVERIRISKHTVTGEQPVSALVRREVVDTPNTTAPST